ncbi:MAG: hypothetical protein HYV38_00605 [Candidatus Levybacteria bacterium]|nr:hypothetical protein [Candidatus Levybacteria bacterium]MBI2420571.1 hypothetical protein [Candidatus Levybacteria bacterium]MBI4098253.1 hypothetical protein [Candidatus Levybacteria bacterium]
MDRPRKIPNIKNITISGRIGTGTTTLALNLSKVLHWKVLEGGVIFEKLHDHLNIHEVDVQHRPDQMDLEYEEMIKKILQEETENIIQSHLAGFDAQGLKKVFKILVVCEDDRGNDKLEIRIDRLTNRKKIPLEEAKAEVLQREQRNLEKWRRLYANNDPNWVYWDPKYYDLIINTYHYNSEESLHLVLEKLGIKK